MKEEEFEYEEQYETLRQKYSLPGFENLAQDFDIEKIQEKESNFLLREIRRIINEKFSAYFHLFENFINPSSPSIFIFSLIKNLSDEDKEKIKQFYEEISKLQIQIIKLDTVYSEEAEANFIKESFSRWQKMKPQILQIIENIESKEKENKDNSQKSYFN